MNLWNRLKKRVMKEEDDEAAPVRGNGLNGHPSASLILANFDEAMARSSERLDRVGAKADRVSLPPMPLEAEG